LSHFQALQETDPSLSKFILHFGIPNACNRWYNYCKSACDSSYITYKSLINLDLFLEGPEDDSKESKHVALK